MPNTYDCLRAMVKFCEQKIILPAYGLCFYINMRTFPVFRDWNYINSVRLLPVFFFLIFIYSFLIDIKSRKGRLTWKSNFSFWIFLLTEFLDEFGFHVHVVVLNMTKYKSFLKWENLMRIWVAYWFAVLHVRRLLKD